MSQYPDQTALKVLHATADSDDLRNQLIRRDAHRGKRQNRDNRSAPRSIRERTGRSAEEENAKKRTKRQECGACIASFPDLQHDGAARSP